MKNYGLPIPILFLLLACSFFGRVQSQDNGIAGKTLMGPMCPAVQEGMECPDQSYQATLTVTDLRGVKIVRFQTEKDGTFKVPLSPGDYILHPESPEGIPFPFADEQGFTVLPGEFTRIIVTYDSGIR